MTFLFLKYTVEENESEKFARALKEAFYFKGEVHHNFQYCV